MPYELDDIDIGIINSLQNDGRKSFRQIARELSISTPTIQARYQRLVNIGLIKSVAPVIDSSKLKKSNKQKLGDPAHPSRAMKITKGMSVNITCDLCDGPIASKPWIFRFADCERFFCCSTCKTQYKLKYKGRIESLLKKAKEKN